jgi:hypothetical protein
LIFFCFFYLQKCPINHFQSPQPPQYVYWQRNDRMINYDDSRRDITIETTPGPRTQSRLIIREPQIADSGNYTCSASNTEPASTYVFVSKGTVDNYQAKTKKKLHLKRFSCSNVCHFRRQHGCHIKA